MPHEVEQRELFGDLEPLRRMAVPRALLHLDPLGFIEFKQLQLGRRKGGLVEHRETHVL